LKKKSIDVSEIEEILTKITGRRFLGLKKEDAFVADLDLASVDIIDFIFELEKSYKIGLKIVDFFKYQGVGLADHLRQDVQIQDVIEIVNKRLSQSK